MQNLTFDMQLSSVKINATMSIIAVDGITVSSRAQDETFSAMAAMFMREVAPEAAALIGDDPEGSATADHHIVSEYEGVTVNVTAELTIPAASQEKQLIKLLVQVMRVLEENLVHIVHREIAKDQWNKLLRDRLNALSKQLQDSPESAMTEIVPGIRVIQIATPMDILEMLTKMDDCGDPSCELHGHDPGGDQPEEHDEETEVGEKDRLLQEDHRGFAPWDGVDDGKCADGRAYSYIEDGKLTVSAFPQHATAMSGEPGTPRPNLIEEAMAASHPFGDQPTPPKEGEPGSRSNPFDRGGSNSQSGLHSATTRLGGPIVNG